MKDIRLDDLPVQMVTATLANLPALDPSAIDDLMLGVGEPSSNSLQTHDKQFGLETICVGGGQGMALIPERSPDPKSHRSNP